MHKFYKVLYFLIVSLLLLTGNAFAQKSQGIGTNVPYPRAVLDITVENPNTYPQGLLLPRLTTVQRNSLATVAGLPAGMAVFDSNDLKFYIWSGSWVAAGSSNITTITGTNIASLTTITGGYNIDVPYISIVGINGLVVTSAGASFTINGQNIAQWSNTTSGIFYNSGNVAIGTNVDPTQGKLVVVEDAAVKPAIALSGGGAGKSINMQFARNIISDGGIGIAGSVASFSGIANPGDMVMRAESGNLILSAKNAGGDILFAAGASDTEKMRITNNGKIGINTSTPGSALEIVGYNGGPALNVQAFASGGSPYAIRAANNSSSILFTIQSFNTVSGGGAALFSNSNVSSGVNNPVVKIVASSTIPGYVGLEVQGGLKFSNMNTSGSVLTVDGLGNVGMGTIVASANYFTFTGSNIRTLNNTDNIQLASTTGSYLIGTNNALRMNDGYSVFIGNSGNSTTTGSFNVFMGLNAGANISTGVSNNFFGVNAGNSNTTGNNNNFIGAGTGAANTTGGDNNFIGYSTGSNNTTGSYNVFFSTLAGNYNTSGSYNNFSGYQSGINNTTGNGNIYLGSASGANNSTGNNNIAIGTNSAFSASNYSNSIVLGSYATATGSNQIVMGSNITGLGINTAPTAMLDVNGNARIRNLSISGSVLTVDGLGNLGIGIISGGASQWITTTSGIYTNTFVGIGNSNPTNPLSVLDFFNGGGGRTSAKYDITHGVVPNGNNKAIQLNYSMAGTGGTMQFSGIEVNMNGTPAVTSTSYVPAYSAIFNVSGNGNMVGFQASISGSSLLKKIGFDANVQGTGGTQNIGINVTVSGATNNYAALLNGGNVGIGTIAPTAALDVVGSVRFESMSVSGTVLTVDGLGNVGMAPFASSQWITTTAGIYTNSVVGIGVNTFSGFEALRVNSYNGTKGFIPPYITTVQMVALTASGLSIQDQGALFWNTDIKDVSIWDGTQWQNKSNNNNNSIDNTSWNIYGNNSISGSGMSVAGFGVIGTYDSYGLKFRTNNLDRMFINSIGGISIGNNFLNNGSASQIIIGASNIASGAGNYILGELNTITGNAGLALGYQVHSAHLGAALIGDWSSNAPSYTQSSTNDEMTMRFNGGYRFFSDKTLGNKGLFITKTNTGINIQTPVSALQVNGDVGLGDGTNTGNKPVTIWLKNSSGSSRVAGEIVIVSTVSGAGNDDSFDITATAGNNAVVGVLYEDCTSGSVCRVAVSGVVSVIADVPTVRGQHVITGNAIAGRAGTTPIPSAGASIGVWLQDAITAGSKARVLLR